MMLTMRCDAAEAAMLLIADRIDLIESLNCLVKQTVNLIEVTHVL